MNLSPVGSPSPVQRQPVRFGKVQEFSSVQDALAVGIPLGRAKKPFAYLGIKFLDAKDDVLGGLMKVLPTILPGRTWQVAGDSVAEKHWILSEEDSTQEALDAHYVKVSGEYPTHQLLDKRLFPPIFFIEQTGKETVH